MAQLTVNRISGYSNKFRKIKLVLDDQLIEEIKDGEIKTIQVKPRKHKFKAEIDWCQSNELEFNIHEGENKEFSLKGTNPFLAFFYITFGRHRYLKLESREI